MKKPLQAHLWQAEDYHYHSSAQNEAAKELLQRIHFKSNERFLDVGCGDGKITARISTQLPYGTVLGIDSSSEMISFAQHKFPKKDYTNLEFLQQDAQKLHYKDEFDIVFSSFALQWFPDPSIFFRGAYESLKPHGLLAITVPLDISVALEKATELVTSKVEWLTYFQDFSPGIHLKKEEELGIPKRYKKVRPSTLWIRNSFLFFLKMLKDD